MSHLGEKDWAPLTEPMFLQEAGVICAVLDEAGIPVRQAKPNEQYIYGGLPLGQNTCQVLVPKLYLQQARTLLAAKEKEAEGK